MALCCERFEPIAGRHFNREKVDAELQQYHLQGLGPTTRLLEEGIVEAGVLEGTLLDVGSGIGSLTFALLTRGVTSAVAVDASSALRVAQELLQDEKRRALWLIDISEHTRPS